MPEHVRRPDSLPALLELAHRELTFHINALNTGKAVVKIPRVVNQMEDHPGMHFHPMPELFLQVSGQNTFRFPQEHFTVRPRELCVVPFGMPHGERARAYRGPFFMFVFVYSSTHISFHLSEEGQPGSLTTVLGVSLEGADVERLAGYLDTAIDAYHARTPWSRKVCDGLLTAHLGGLLDLVQQARAARNTESFRIAQVRQLIITRIQNPELSVRTLAEWVRCSPDYLSHQFRQETGVKLTEYINEQRVRYARQLLQTTSMDIAEVAYAVGHNAPSYFARIFRRYTGQTAKQYRNTRS